LARRRRARVTESELRIPKAAVDVAVASLRSDLLVYLWAVVEELAPDLRWEHEARITGEIETALRKALLAMGMEEERVEDEAETGDDQRVPITLSRLVSRWLSVEEP
jgi:hypothetical protein